MISRIVEAIYHVIGLPLALMVLIYIGVLVYLAWDFFDALNQ